MERIRNLLSRRGVRQSLSNVSWLSGDRIIRMFGAVIVTTFVARYLGPSQFGLLNYGIAIYGLFNVVSNLGLDSLVVRDLALNETEEPVVLGTAFMLKAGASVVTTIAAVVAAWLLDPHNRILILIVALYSVGSISQALDVVDYLFQSQTKARYSVVPRTIVFVVASIVRLAAVFLHSGLLVFAWIGAIEVLLSEVGLLLSYLSVRRLAPRWNWHFDRGKAFLRESWPLLISGVMVTIYMRTDQVLLGKLGSMEAVGNYTAAIRFSEIWYAIPVMLVASVMPRMLRTRETDLARYNARLQTLYESMVFVSVAIAGATLVLGPLLIRLFYGNQYHSAAGVLSIHIWTGVFVGVGCIGSQQYIHENITAKILRRTALGAIANVVLNLLWIPRWGGMGSAMATLVAQGLAAYLGDAIDLQTRHIFRMKTRAYLRFWTLPKRFFYAQ